MDNNVHVEMFLDFSWRRTIEVLTRCDQLSLKNEQKAARAAKALENKAKKASIDDCEADPKPKKRAKARAKGKGKAKQPMPEADVEMEAAPPAEPGRGSEEPLARVLFQEPVVMVTPPRLPRMAVSSPLAVQVEIQEAVLPSGSGKKVTGLQDMEDDEVKAAEIASLCNGGSESEGAPPPLPEAGKKRGNGRGKGKNKDEEAAGKARKQPRKKRRTSSELDQRQEQPPAEVDPEIKNYVLWMLRDIQNATFDDVKQHLIKNRSSAIRKVQLTSYWTRAAVGIKIMLLPQKPQVCYITYKNLNGYSWNFAMVAAYAASHAMVGCLQTF